MQPLSVFLTAWPAVPEHEELEGVLAGHTQWRLAGGTDLCLALGVLQERAHHSVTLGSG